MMMIKIRENGRNGSFCNDESIAIYSLRELESNEPVNFKNYLRMENLTFYELLNLVRPYIEKQNTMTQESICAEERLVATLPFLATGHSYKDLKFLCTISAQALGKIISETC